ncbi:oxidoreductase [Aliidongia dinghuensis]|uniref:Oxidoreductase n=1 Tax=Aliidongia dinghuensis TaxID=1867774 RepID=A0A8J2Z0Z2_9PROT|nr:Gfo/Idh/MocA family oxidoreductase [Aliidongia dinghuensis]GGF49444.1 oxidoreductase [Aliidongia dinghuensis]
MTERLSERPRPFGVGFIGVEPARSWAWAAHLPAIKRLPEDFRFVGLANRSVESSRRAAAVLGEGRAFDSIDDLLASDEVDLVVVTVKAAHHAPIVERVLARGKHVFCEWPLAVNLTEAEALVRLAAEAKARSFIGKQGRVGEALCAIREIVGSGALGNILSTTVVGAAGVWGASIARANVYSLEVTQGANVLTVVVGHMLAALEFALGQVDSVNAVLSTGRPWVKVESEGGMAAATAPDQVAICGTLASGAVLSVHYRGGLPSGAGITWEVYGSDGMLRLEGASGQNQMTTYTITGSFPGAETALAPFGAAAAHHPGDNVARLYAAIARDLREGTRTAPDFEDALRTHRLIAAIENAATTGQKQYCRS